MFSLVYRSKVNPVFGQTEIAEMLAKAKESNQRRNITGCLLFYQGSFLQYLEGNQVKVLQLFDKIKEDAMHTAVEVLSYGNIEEREFQDWEMAYENFMGSNHHLQYLVLLVSAYIENPKRPVDPNPTSASFWSTTEKLLKTKALQNSEL